MVAKTPTLTDCPTCRATGRVESSLSFRQKTCEDYGGKARITPANIHSEATHVLVRARRAGVISRHQVRQVRLASGTEWAMIARIGQMLG